MEVRRRGNIQQNGQVKSFDGGLRVIEFRWVDHTGRVRISAGCDVLSYLYLELHTEPKTNGAYI